MSVSVSRADGVTVFTLTSDPQSRWPPLCQIFKNLCYSPVCCSVSQHLKKVQRTSLTVLGTLHIMVGVLYLAFGTIAACAYFGFWTQINETAFPFWLGALFILFGITCILSEKYPSPCLIILNVTLNLLGVAFAITGIVMSGIDIGNSMFMWLDCEERYYWRYTTPSPSAEEKYFKEKCLEGKVLIKTLLIGINAVLLVLAVLELCVAISSAVLGIKTLRTTEEKPQKSSDDPESYKPLLEDVTTEPAA